eukprot:10397930-Prorocentrum_lima.AAC.1
MEHHGVAHGSGIPPPPDPTPPGAGVVGAQDDDDEEPLALEPIPKAGGIGVAEAPSSKEASSPPPVAQPAA